MKEKIYLVRGTRADFEPLVSSRNEIVASNLPRFHCLKNGGGKNLPTDLVRCGLNVALRKGRVLNRDFINLVGIAGSFLGLHHKIRARRSFPLEFRLHRTLMRE